MKKYIFLYGVFFFISFPLFAQEPKIEFGETMKDKGTQISIAHNDYGLFVLRTRKSTVYLEFFDAKNLSRNYSTKINFRDPVKHEFLEFKKGLMFQGKLILLASAYDKSANKNRLYVSVYEGSGKLVKDWKELSSFAASSLKNSGEYEVRLSPDGKRILVYAQLPKIKNQPHRFSLNTFDTELNSMWKKEFESNEGQTTIDDFCISNSGNAYVVAHNIPTTNSEKRTRSRAKQVKSKYYLLYYDMQKDSSLIQDLDVNEKALATARIQIDQKNNVYVAGFYEENKGRNKGLGGVFYARIKAGTFEFETQNVSAFSKEFIKKINAPDEFSPAKSDGNKYQLRNIHLTDEGGIALVAEEFYFTEGDGQKGANRESYAHFENVIVVCLNSEGVTTAEQIIYKYGVSSGIRKHLSISSLFIKGRIHVVYNQSLEDFQDRNLNVSTDDLSKNEKYAGAAIVASVSTNGKIEFTELYRYAASLLHTKGLSTTRLRASGMAYSGNGILIGVADDGLVGSKYKITRIQF